MLTKVANIVELFGKEVSFKDNICNSSGQYQQGKDYRYNLYISITDVCLASCPFCNNSTKKKTTKSDKKFDLDKLKLVIEELKAKKLINRISITGGEPLLDIDLLNKVLNLVFEVCGEHQIVTINTNGVNLENIFKLDRINKIYGIHISRHHYKDEINDEIFGFKTAHIDDIKKVIERAENKQLIRLNSLLMKDFIDSKSEVEKYLEMSGNLGVFRVGFVGLMPLNDYSKEHFIEYKDIFDNLCEKSVVVKQFYNMDICDCINGMYMADNGQLVEFYARNVRNLCPCNVGQLNYTYDNKLCAGFNNPIF